MLRFISLSSSGISLFRSRATAALARVLVLAGAVFLADRSLAVTNLFSTRFEASGGYDAAFELIGQNGWVTDSASYGGNGLLTNFLGSQAAYIGLFPLDPPADYLALWQPITYTPVQSGNPVVRFSVLMSIVDSTTTNRDDFYWSVYTSSGHSLFTIDFYNEDLGIYYALDDANTLLYSGQDFANDVPYTLTVTMDFAQNKWSAMIDTRTIVTNKAISAAGVPLNLGDIDALWIPASASTPGDNYMIFDNYQILAYTPPPPPPHLASLGRSTNGQFSLRLDSPLWGARYAIDATTNFTQWVALRTNIATTGSFQFTDTNSPGLPRRLYRARPVP